MEKPQPRSNRRPSLLVRARIAATCGCALGISRRATEINGCSTLKRTTVVSVPVMSTKNAIPFSKSSKFCALEMRLPLRAPRPCRSGWTSMLPGPRRAGRRRKALRGLGRLLAFDIAPGEDPRPSRSRFYQFSPCRPSRWHILGGGMVGGKVAGKVHGIEALGGESVSCCIPF